MHNIADIRKTYSLKTLSEAELDPNPINQFNTWWAQAIESKLEEVNAMTLATVNEQGKPSARIVLLKTVTPSGFTFFTNYNSRKAQNLQSNNNAALVIFWAALERQIRIEGVVEKTSEADSDTYFNIRPTESKIGAWTSPQSSVIASRAVIEATENVYKKQFENEPITRPPHWGGYILKPNLVEFWQGRPSRLHDRLQYTLQSYGNWIIERLAP